VRAAQPRRAAHRGQVHLHAVHVQGSRKNACELGHHQVAAGARARAADVPVLRPSKRRMQRRSRARQHGIGHHLVVAQLTRVLLAVIDHGKRVDKLDLHELHVAVRAACIGLSVRPQADGRAAGMWGALPPQWSATAASHCTAAGPPGASSLTSAATSATMPPHPLTLSWPLVLPLHRPPSAQVACSRTPAAPQGASMQWASRM